MLKANHQYSRSDIFKLSAIPEPDRVGDWCAGYRKHNGAWFIFMGAGVPDRTGHDYGDHGLRKQLLWHGKANSRRGQPVVEDLISGRCPVRVFWQTDDRAQFTYAGLVKAVEVHDTVPVTVLWSFDVPGQIPGGAIPGEVAENAARRDC